MAEEMTRRTLFATAGAAVAIDATAMTGAAGAAGVAAGGLKIVGVACSPRKGKTTATSLKICLEAAAQVDRRIETELIELAGMVINGAPAAGQTMPTGHPDDFEKLVPKLGDAKVGGIIIGTPVYFNNMSYLCKAFLDRCIAFRKNNFALSDKVAGVLAVGAARNGGQELTIRSVQSALMCQEMIIVGDKRPGARMGAALWNNSKDDITADEAGIAAARNLGRRVAEVALKLRGA
ncbi:MAG: flavodoxin family protein [Phycisphaerales bacterium]|nr:MAG: flavodoxin family protein [Phycisphaerales bacterium]